MKYLLTLWGDEAQWESASEEDLGAMMEQYQAFSREAAEAGVMLGGEGLEDTRAATTVRVRDGERSVTDGPFMETKEQLGGYYLLECKDLDEAIGWASKLPAAHGGSVEIRPVMNYDQAGYDRDETGTSVG